MKKSMKLIRILLLIGLALVLVMSVAAQVEPISINDIDLDVTVIDLKILQNGNLALKLAATGSGIIDCGTNQACIDANLHSTTANIAQGFNLNIVIDVIGAGVVSGQTAGQLEIVDAQTDPWGFTGNVKGSFIADPTYIDFQLLVKAGGKFGRKLNMDLSGVFNKVISKFENLEGDSFFVPARFPFSS